MSQDPTSDKAEAKTVSFPASFWEKIEAKAGTNKGARSQYLQDLVKADLEGGSPLPHPSEADTIVQLAQSFTPTTCGILKQWLDRQEINQPHLIAQCLISLADNLALAEAIEQEARRLGVTFPDVLRLAVIQYLAANNGTCQCATLNAMAGSESIL